MFLVLISSEIFMLELDLSLKEKEKNCQMKTIHFKDTFSFNYNFICYNLKTSIKTIFVKKNYLI